MSLSGTAKCHIWWDITTSGS